MSKATDRSPKEYEFARKIMKKEAKSPSIYSENRKRAVLERVHKAFGEKGLKEFAREFKKEIR